MQNDDHKSGRHPPPDAHKFLKDRSGNKRGRPKGAISTKRLTRKVAGRKIQLRGRRVTLLDALFLRVPELAAAGDLRAATALDRLRYLYSPPTNEDLPPALVVPEERTMEESIKDIEEWSKHLKDPREWVDVAAIEGMKARRGEDSALGRALNAFYDRWGAGPALKDTLISRKEFPDYQWY